MAKRRDRRRNPRHRKIQQQRGIIDGSDFINSMPDEILHHILSFIPMDLAARTSVLSKRWRHVWCENPSLNISEFTLKAESINQALISYKASKITSCNLHVRLADDNATHFDKWIEFAISRNAKKLLVSIVDNSLKKTYTFPHFFYLSSSVEQLVMRLFCFEMIPKCRVFWKSLKELTLGLCELRDESIENILSGCPVLESLTLSDCSLLEHLDLSKSLSLRRLDIDRIPIEIVAPHIHYLRLRDFRVPSTFVDVSSLTEAKLDIGFSYTCASEARIFQTMELEMLAKLHNVDMLTVGPTLLQILSLAELRGVPFPTLKIQTLIVKTEFARSVIPGIARLLRNSPGLKKLVIHTMHSCNIMDMGLDRYWDSQGLNPYHCWRSRYEVFPNSYEIYSMLGCNDATSRLLASFVELVLRNAKTLEKIVVCLVGGIHFDHAEWFEQMVGTLPYNNNVFIVFKRCNFSKYLHHHCFI